MPVLTIGNTTIPFRVRFSATALRKRIVVTPEGVEVVAPEGTPWDGPDGLLAYVEGKRRWVFDSVREIEQKHKKLLTQRYASGAKLQYRGRWLMLDVHEDDVDQVEMTCRSKFHVKVPHGLDGKKRLEAVKAAFDTWLKDRARKDLQTFARRHQKALGFKARGVRLGNQKQSWGTCGRDDVIRVHWGLIQAPAAAMDYVVAHEVAHLRHRNHSPEFWALLATTMPDWAERKQMLERWEGDHRAV